MRLLIQVFLVGCVAMALANGASIVKAKPFSDVKHYSVSGVLSLPYAEIAETFDAWYDVEQFASRIDYYGVCAHNII